VGGRWRRRRGARIARDLGLPYDGNVASRSADAVRRPLDDADVRVRATPGGRLADGLIIDASIVARLLGLRLLTLDARIRFVPAQFTTSGSPASPTLPVTHRTGAPLGDRWPLSPLWSPPGQAGSPLRGLGDAADLLADARRTLDRVRQDLSTSLRTRHGQETRNQDVRDIQDGRDTGAP